MIIFRKAKVWFLLIFIFLNIFYIAPCYSLSLREDLFKNALDLSSSGKFNLALQEWNQYLDSYPDDAAGLSNRGNVRLVIGDVEGSIDDQNKAISLNPSEIDPKGLDSLDRHYLSFLNQNNNIPTGLDSIASGLGDDSSMLEFVVEPYLIKIGFLTRTPRGRLLTAIGKKYIDSKDDNF